MKAILEKAKAVINAAKTKNNDTIADVLSVVTQQGITGNEVKQVLLGNDTTIIDKIKSAESKIKADPETKEILQSLLKRKSLLTSVKHAVISFGKKLKLDNKFITIIITSALLLLVLLVYYKRKVTIMETSIFKTARQAVQGVTATGKGMEDISTAVNNTLNVFTAERQRLGGAAGITGNRLIAISLVCGLIGVVAALLSGDWKTRVSKTLLVLGLAFLIFIAGSTLKTVGKLYVECHE
jgi:hypothetical protein